ncbi:MAG TPA: hypothetical protein VET83_03550 [Candidatus Dormibacteraeota bacterium]|nr:hypothetical protein [Candidatus Dormibacteraeota bacterium]
MHSRLHGIGRIGGKTFGVLVAMAALAAAAGTSAAAPAVKAAPSAASDSSMTLRAGQAGTEFRSMTVEGEDRVHIDFGRPELTLDLDPEQVPGLTRGTALDVLNRTRPELSTPLIALSSQERSPYVAKPWLRKFATGPVAVFRPAVTGAVRWRLLVADSRGQTVASFDGTGDPPKEIAWDGRTKSGALVTPGLTYSYVFEAHDRAGNKRSFVGQGFDVSAYRSDTPAGAMLAMSGRDLVPAENGGTSYGPSSRTGKETPPIFLEVATWLNQSPQVGDPIRVTVGARSLDQATMLGNRAVASLSGRVIGDPARVHMVTEVAPDAPEDGVLRIGSWTGSATTPPRK